MKLDLDTRNLDKSITDRAMATDEGRLAQALDVVLYNGDVFDYVPPSTPRATPYICQFSKDSGDHRPYLLSPHKVCGWAVATTGSMMLGVAGDCDFPLWAGPPDIPRELFSVGPWSLTSARLWRWCGAGRLRRESSPQRHRDRTPEADIGAGRCGNRAPRSRRSELQGGAVSGKGRVHWGGGVRFGEVEYLAGWPCCCSGERCRKIAATPGAMTVCASDVTCVACKKTLAKDETRMRDNPRARAERIINAALSRACVYCGARSGDRCVTPTGTRYSRIYQHIQRWELARREVFAEDGIEV